ncbi:hypothetical protein M9H77_17414 [Catharanthus roseus]|uniref:Uncharacterized protein n=1 Tax=Catharanthus roseus TaxID=4058 RepID=A0ACC0B4I2_CATRO|nr:hypothetical protein M9H77_17414 [Catharanthus roseus]
MVSGYHTSVHWKSSKSWYSYGWKPTCCGQQTDDDFSTLKEIDDMAKGVIQEPLSSATQIASFAKKVQIIIRSHRVAGARKPYRSVVLVELRGGARRLPGGARGGRPLSLLIWVDDEIRIPNVGERGEGSGGRGHRDLGSFDHIGPFDSPDLDMQSLSLGLTQPALSHPGGLGTSYVPHVLGFSSFRSPHPPGLGFSSFQAPPHLGTVSSSFQAPPPSIRMDDATLAQQLRFGHRVRKKTTRFMPSDWP